MKHLLKIANKIKYRSNLGQIQLNHEIGKWLFFLSSLGENKVIVEIGTWNGRGSSFIIAQAVKNRSDKALVYGYEIDPIKHSEAEEFLKKYPFFNVFYGSIVCEADLDTSNLNLAEKEWLRLDLNNLKKAPDVQSTIPSQIDLLVLDGGEFSTYAEFKKLSPKLTRWLVLDDVNTRKSQRIIQELKEGDEYTLIWMSDERNGAAVLQKNCAKSQPVDCVAVIDSI